jgi:hypothetical protein
MNRTLAGMRMQNPPHSLGTALREFLTRKIGTNAHFANGMQGLRPGAKPFAAPRTRRQWSPHSGSPAKCHGDRLLGEAGASVGEPARVDRDVGARHGRCSAGRTRPRRTGYDPQPAQPRRMGPLRSPACRHLATVRQYRAGAEIPRGLIVLNHDPVAPSAGVTHDYLKLNSRYSTPKKGRINVGNSMILSVNNNWIDETRCT